MIYQRIIDRLVYAVAGIREHDKEEGICLNMCEYFTLAKASAEDARSRDRQEAIALIEKAMRLLKGSWS